MNSTLLYQWQQEIDKHFADWGRWQKRGLGLLSSGMIEAESCRLYKVARQLTAGKQVESMERRLQRWLANENIDLEQAFAAWIGWVMSQWGKAALLLLVDETKLGDRVSVMMVSAYYRGSAIPLIWRAYASDAYPFEGQVGLLTDLLARLRAYLPEGRAALLLADRGLGTSPQWQEALTALGWDYLLRVQGTTHIRCADGKSQPMRRLVGYGQQWCGRVQVFKKAGWRWLTVYVLWAVGYREPWCLVSNCPTTDPTLYGWRFSQEASFRDLKSDGFAWHKSQIGLPAHVERLLLALAVAMLWTLSTGTLVWHMYPLTKRQQRHSTFRLGLDELFARCCSLKQVYLELFLVPDTPSLKTVVP